MIKKTYFTDDEETSVPGSKQDANDFCDGQNSFLRRYLTAQDICPNGRAQHWTGGRRAVHQYKVLYKGLITYNKYNKVNLKGIIQKYTCIIIS